MIYLKNIKIYPPPPSWNRSLQWECEKSSCAAIIIDMNSQTPASCDMWSRDITCCNSVSINIINLINIVLIADNTVGKYMTLTVLFPTVNTIIQLQQLATLFTATTETGFVLFSPLPPLPYAWIVNTSSKHSKDFNFKLLNV